MIEHYPILIVVLPLLAAPICVLLRHHMIVRIFAVAVTWLILGLTFQVLDHVQTEGIISYHLGGWAPPLGIEYRVDIANTYVAMIVTAISSVVLAFGQGRAGSIIPQERVYLYYAVILLAITGLLGMALTGDAFNVFVFLEISSLATYTLVAMGKGRRAKMAAYSYLIIGTIGGTFILLGIGLVYQCTGTLNMADLTRMLPEVYETYGKTIRVAFAFLFVGASIKLALFPLHQWLPNAYTYAPSAVSALLAATATKVSYYILVRIVFTIFGVAFVFDQLKMHYILVPVSLIAMFSGSIAAIYQTDIKRLLAYSSIAQIGYMALGMSMHNLDGLTGGLVHLFNHAVMKGGLFLAVACITWRLNSSKISDMKGLGRQMPITGMAIVIGGLALIGVPSTAGFISKWYLVLGAMEQGWMHVAFLILLSSLLAVIYVWKIVETLYFAEPTNRVKKCKEVPFYMYIPVLVLIGACIVFGLWTDLTASVAEAAANQLMGVSP